MEHVTIEETRKTKLVSEFPEGVMELQQKLLEAAIVVFNQKGMKFTMDDLARQLEISKKTIYTVFLNKEELLYGMVDYMFDSIKESERAIVEDERLSLIEKIRSILVVLPAGYRELDFSQLYQLKEKYPRIYQKVEYRLETGWETTIALLEQGIAEGVIRSIRIPIFKMMFEAALEQFFQRDILAMNGISYTEALDEVLGILMDGIIEM